EDGWWQIAPLARTAVRQGQEISTETLDAVAPVLVARGGAFRTCQILLNAGAAVAAADIICSVQSPYLDTINQREAAAMFRVMGMAGVDRADLLLCKARVHRNLAELREHAQAINEAVAKAAEHGDEATGAIAQAEQLYLSTGSLDGETIRRRVDELRGQAAALPNLPTFEVRCRELDAMTLAHSDDLADVLQSVELLEGVATEWEHLGDRAQAAATRRLLAATALHHLGRYNEAIATLEHAKTLLPDNIFSRALTCQLLARFYALAGDLQSHEQARHEATVFAGALNLSWLTAYLYWSAMMHSSLSDDGAGVAWNHADARAHLGQLVDHETGLLFLCESAIAFAVVGNPDRAIDSLEEARPRRHENPLELSIAEIVVEARVGDPGAGYAAAQRLLGTDLPPGRRWRVMVELLVAAGKMDPAPDTESMRNSLDKVTEELGLQATRRLLLPSDVREEEIPDQSSVAVNVLGDFSLRVGGAMAEAPTGQAALLLKILAVRGQPVPVEVIADLMWPESEAALGRRRLKNVVRRLRTALGVQSVSRTEHTIGLTATVSVDAAAFEVEANRAAELAARDDPLAVPTSINALGLYRGELLPTDLYSSWISSERERFRATAVSTLEYLIGVADQQDVPVGWLLEMANQLGVRSERVYVSIAILAIAKGSEETARAALARASFIADELGIPLAGVAGLEDLLG
ncbi:MAG: hypothetical protein AAFN30_04160, partial [Actinomycetota bacterium]